MTGPCPQEGIAKLLRYESSALPAGQLTSLQDYAGRMRAGTRSIYYLCAPSRHLAEHSPYYEAMKQKNTEVGEPRGRWGPSTCSRVSAQCKWLNVPRTQESQAARVSVQGPGVLGPSLPSSLCLPRRRPWDLS